MRPRIQAFTSSNWLGVNGESSDVSAVIGLPMRVIGVEFWFFAASLDKGLSDKAGMSYRPRRLLCRACGPSEFK